MKKMRRIAIGLAMLACAAWAADELTLSTGWKYNKNTRTRQVVTTSADWDVTGNYVIENVQSITTNTAGEVLELGGVTTAGFGWFHNGDLTNYVEIGVYDSTGTNFLSFLKLTAGQLCPVWLGTTQVVARANTAEVKLDYVMTDR